MKTKKELLTKDRVTSDVKEVFDGLRKRLIRQTVISVSILALAVILLVSLIDSYVGYFYYAGGGFIDAALYVITGIVLTVMTVIPLVRTAKKCKQFNSADYFIVRDRLERVEEDTYPPFKMATRRRSVDVLHFEKYGSYAIPASCYNWSKDFYMSSKGIVNTSIVGDEFYITLDRKDPSRPVCVYNSKLFLLDRELEDALI